VNPQDASLRALLTTGPETTLSKSGEAENPTTDERKLIMMNAIEAAAGNGVGSLWTIDDVSGYLRVPVATLYAWRVRGEGPPALRLGRHLRFLPSSVRAWARSQPAA